MNFASTELSKKKHNRKRSKNSDLNITNWLIGLHKLRKKLIVLLYALRWETYVCLDFVRQLWQTTASIFHVVAPAIGLRACPAKQKPTKRPPIIKKILPCNVFSKAKQRKYPLDHSIKGFNHICCFLRLWDELTNKSTQVTIESNYLARLDTKYDTCTYE